MKSIPARDDGSKSISRALDILECFSLYNPALSVTDLSEMIGIPFSSAARIARALKERGYLERDSTSKKFRLGRKIYFLGYTAKESNFLWIVSKPYLSYLRKRFNETTAVYLRDGLQRVCFEQEESTETLRYSGPIGASYEMQAGSPSKVFWAFLDWNEVVKVTSAIVPSTSYTVVDQPTIRRIIDEIHRDGYVVSRDDYVVGYSSVSAPVFNAKMDIIATITITVPSFRFTPEVISAMCPLVRDAGIEISKSMGCNYRLLRKKYPVSFPISHRLVLKESDI